MGFIMLILFAIMIGCIYGLAYLSGRGNRTGDSTVIRTKRSLQDVVRILKMTASELKADIDKIEDDPFGDAAGDTEDVAVVLVGNVGILSRNTWAVQVYVIETNDGCEIELIALGDSLPSGYRGTIYVGRNEMKFSKKYRDIIAGRLY